MNHLQNVILSIAKDIDLLCKKNNIPYFLDGGTALGAIRHNGFIPWDDDFDIILLPEHYQAFINMCKTQLDAEKYSFYEAEKDWPMHISKIKLKETTIEEIDEYPMNDKGIYIDIFCFDNASNIKIIRYLQWLCTRIWVVLMIASKPYTPNSNTKKLLISIAKIVNSKKIRSLFRKLGRSKKQSRYLSMSWCRTRNNWSKYFCPRDYFNISIIVPFEDTTFPVANQIDKYLKTCFGDYMVLPPIEKRIGLHIKSVDFGKY